MSVVLIGSRDAGDVTKAESWDAAVLPNRKVLVRSFEAVKGVDVDEAQDLKSQIENTIKVRSAAYTEHTGEEHMPVDRLFAAVMSSWSTQVGVAVAVEDDAAKKIMKEAGIS